MSDPCNCEQALALTDALRDIANGQFNGRATEIAKKALREWEDGVTVTICRTQDITVTFDDSDDSIMAIDEEGNLVDLTDEEVAVALDLKNAGIDETGR